VGTAKKKKNMHCMLSSATKYKEIRLIWALQRAKNQESKAKGCKGAHICARMVRSGTHMLSLLLQWHNYGANACISVSV
jgi:hypothetical protein